MTEKIGGPAALAHAQRSVQFGYMIIVMANEDFTAMAMEMHYPDSFLPYANGEREVDENWRAHSILAASENFNDLL